MGAAPASFDDKIISDADARFGKEKREKINLTQGFTIRTMNGFATSAAQKSFLGLPPLAFKQNPLY